MNTGPVILAPSGVLAAKIAADENWYEAAQNTPNRFEIYHPIQSPKRDLDRFTRQELVRKSRYLYKNSPFIRGLIERMVTLTVGIGFYPVFKSGSEEWNERAARVWKKKSRNIHLGARATFSQYQRCIARARFLDGEGFSLKTESQTTFDSLIQGLESDMICGTRGSEKPKDGGVDGFNLNAQGEVISYNIRNVTAPYDAAHVVHHFTPNRLGQYRGEPILASAINTAVDIEDILALEKDAVKDASSKQDIIKTATGELNREAWNAVRFGDYGSGGVPAFNLPQSETSKDDYYTVKFGGRPVVLRKGDEYTPYVPNRPGNAWQGFMAFLANTVCVSTLFPPSVILPVQLGGTDVRRDLDIAQRVVDPWQLDISIELDQLLDYLLEPEMMDGGELAAGKPSDYDRRDWYFPAKVNVDRGQIKSDIEQVQAGLMSREEFHARWGDDSRIVDATILLEAKRRKEKILASGFESVKEFAQVLSLAPQLWFGQDQGKAGEEPEPKGKPKKETEDDDKD